MAYMYLFYTLHVRCMIDSKESINNDWDEVKFDTSSSLNVNLILCIIHNLKLLSISAYGVCTVCTLYMTCIFYYVLFYSAIVNFTKFKGSREHVYDNAIAEVVSTHLHFFFLPTVGPINNQYMLEC